MKSARGSARGKSALGKLAFDRNNGRRPAPTEGLTRAAASDG